MEILKQASKKCGLPPGALVHTGEQKIAESKITIIDYDEQGARQYQASYIEELTRYKTSDTVTWINIEGLHDVQLIAEVEQHFNIPPLVLEDILNTHQRPKLDDYGDFLFIVLKSLVFDHDDSIIKYEQISLLVLDGIVITFTENADDLFAPVAQQLQNSQGRYRKQGVGFLAYQLLDTIVDQYFIFQDALDHYVVNLEDELLFNATEATLSKIHKLRREVIFIRRSIAPVREILAILMRCESSLIDEKTHFYLSDVYDHAIRVIEAMESYRDVVSGMIDIYLSHLSNKMNEVMKTLTMFATVFIPLTFVAGIYGMNFKNMPELEWQWSYPLFWCILILQIVFSIIYFKRKNWL